MTEKQYTSKAEVRTIKATSRISTKIKDDFYTMEYCEERVLPDNDLVDIEMERELLWDTVNKECDNQISDIYDAIRSQEENIKHKISKY